MAILAREFVKNSHWYSKKGDPFHTIPKKNEKGNRVTTLADARELGLFPSVTTIL